MKGGGGEDLIFEERMTEAERKTSGDRDSKKKVWQRDLAWSLYLVIYVV